MRKKPLNKAFRLGLSLVLMLAISTPSLGATTASTKLPVKTDRIHQSENNLKPSLSDQIQALRKIKPTNPTNQTTQDQTSTDSVLTKSTDSKPRKSTWKDAIVPNDKKPIKVDPSKTVKSKPTYVDKTTKGSVATVPNQLIVKFKQSTNSQASRDKYSLQKVKGFPSIGAELLATPKGVSVETVINSLIADNAVEYAQPNYKYKKSDIPSDPMFGSMWGLQNTGQNISGSYGTPGIDINAPGAWDITKGSDTVIVADIDTGVDINHPDLQGQIWTNPGEIPGNGIDDDYNGFVDDVNGWDFYHWDNTLFDPGDTDPDDGSPSDSHGTHTSGTIAATMNNSQGVTGVAPNVKVMPIKFLGPDGGSTSEAISAIAYASSKGAKIANCSWGGGSYDQALHDIIQYSGMLFCISAGNYGENTDLYPQYPASYDCSNILSVAAIDNTGNLAPWSNYGTNTVDVAAPGVAILSTTPDNDYQFWSGTSMAAPHVSGTSALLYSIHPDMTPEAAAEMIKSTGTPLSSLQGKVGSSRLINAANAVNAQPTSLDDDIPGVPLSGAIVNDTVNATSDKDDVYYLWLNEGETITTSLSGDTNTDFDLYLFDPYAWTVNCSQEMVAYSENAGTSSENIQYTAPYAGYYYIDVFAYSGSGAYSLTAGNGEGSYEDDNGSLIFNGPWSTLNGSQYSGGTAKQINSRGDVQFNFVGSQIELYSFKDNTQGIANVYIDGGWVKAIDLYSPVFSPSQIVFQNGVSSYGNHTIKIEWSGLRNPAARKTSTNINVDKLIVSSDTTPPSAPTLNDIYFSTYYWAPSITWNTVPETDVAWYGIYRQEGSSGMVLSNKQLIKPQDILSWEDYTAIPGYTYQYTVTACDYAGNESAHSQPKTYIHDDDLPGIPMVSTSASGTLASNTDVFDVWSVHLDAGQTYAFSFNGDSGTDFDYALFSPDATSLVESFPVRYVNQISSEEYFTYPATTSGTYYVVTYACSGSGAYNFNVTSKTTVNNDNIPGSPLPSNNKASDFLDPFDLDDVYSVVLQAGDTINVTLSSQAQNSNDFDVYLFPPDATTVNPNDPAYKPNVAGSSTQGTSTESYSYVAPSAGTYYIDVYNYSGSGPYDLNVTLPSSGSEPITIEDSDSRITYTGTWSSTTEAGNSGGTIKYSGTASSSAQLNFTGTGIKMLSKTGPNKGLADIYIDNVLYVTIDLYSPSNTYQVNAFSLSGLSNTSHTIKVVVKGSKCASSSGVTVILDAFVVSSAATSTTVVEDNDSNIGYAGTWSSTTEPGNSGGTIKYSASASSSAQLNFTGTGIKMLTKTGPNKGLADIYIDDLLNKTINLYSPNNTYQVNAFELSGLSNTSHKIKVVVKGTKSASSSGTTVILDAFVVTSINPTSLKIGVYSPYNN